MSAVERSGNGGSGVLRLGLPVSTVAGGLIGKASVLRGLWRFNGGVGGRMVGRGIGAVGRGCRALCRVEKRGPVYQKGR